MTVSALLDRYAEMRKQAKVVAGLRRREKLAAEAYRNANLAWTDIKSTLKAAEDNMANLASQYAHHLVDEVMKNQEPAP